MNNFQKIGGIAALIDAVTYLIGIGMAVTVLSSGLALPPAEYVAYIAENLNLLVIWHLIIYLVNAVFLVVLVLALHQRLQGGATALSQTAAAFGLIWAGLVIASGMLIIVDLGVINDLYAEDPELATTVWLSLSTVESALGGGIEMPGGLWVLLVSWAGLQTKGLPRVLNYIGLLVGLAGIVTVVPALTGASPIFGLGFIIWFLWVGIVMIREDEIVTA